MKFLFTADVELTSIPRNREDPSIAGELRSVGLPRVLDVCSRFDIPATFYFTANCVELAPETLDLVRQRGHEIGCHGLRHDPRDGYDVMPYRGQVKSIEKARRVLERHGSGTVRAFRSPEARIGADTVRALADLGFTSDSSVCPQRFDGLLSRGFRHKLRWLAAPRRPYFLSRTSPTSPGDTNVLEIPISALVFPFIGTTMRVSPGLCRLLRRVLFLEARKRTDVPVVFLFHPNECLDYQGAYEMNDRGRALVSDRFRTSLKMRNLGPRAVDLLGEILSSAKTAGFDFLTASAFRSAFQRG